MRIAESTVKILAKIPLPDEVAVVHRQAAIVDIGSCTTRIGFAGDDAPRLHEPTCVVKGSERGATSLCLKKAYDVRDTADVSRVIEKGKVDWDAMEQLLTYLENLLQLNVKDLNTPLMLTEKMLVPRVQREKMAEILMEKHGLSSIYFGLSPVLALYAGGVCSGVSVEMGYSACHVVPVFQGYPLFHATHTINFGGDFCTRYMMSAEPCKLPDLVHPSHHIDVWEHLKEKYCETCPSSSAFRKAREELEENKNNSRSSDNKNNNSSKYAVKHRLPDGTVIVLGTDRFVPAEMFFDPSLIPEDVLNFDQFFIDNVENLRTSTDTYSLHKSIMEAVGKCDYDLLPMFYDSIHLSGGCSLLRGLPERLGSELNAILPQTPNIVASTERRHATFLGGSILASLPTFQDFWVTKADYEEFGSSAVLRRCF